MIDAEKKNVLFVCNHNSARSQMSEYLLREMFGAQYNVYSAGKFPAEVVHPLAIAVLSEVGIAPDGAVPKDFTAFEGVKFDLIISVCEAKAEDCPVFVFGTTPLNLGVPDPAAIAAQAENMDAKLNQFRIARDQLRQLIRNAIVIFEAEAKREEADTKSTKIKIEDDFKKTFGKEIGEYIKQSLIVSCPPGEEIICIQSSKLELILRDESSKMVTSDLWAWWGLAVALGITILTASFEPTILSSEQWKLVFTLGTVVALSIALFNSVKRFWQHTRKEFVRSVLDSATSSATFEVKT